jgi:monovalent cation:H+ antiporter-2, CPA2 family
LNIALALTELGVVLLALAVAGRIAAFFNLPGTPFYLAVGLALGDGGAIDIAEAMPFIEIGSSLGVIFLLFLLGLEYTPHELRHSLRSNASLGVVDLVFNATPGVLVALVLGWGWMGATVLGGISYISSSGIIAKLLNDFGRLGNRETPMVLSVLVLEDLVMALFLPLLAVALSGGSVVAGAVSGVVSLSIVGFVLFLSSFAERPMNRLIATDSLEIMIITLVGLATLVAGLAEQAHISYAVGAFLLGILLSGRVAEQARELLAPLRDVFAALFFVSFGLSVDPTTLGGTAVAALVLAATSVVSKFATGWWGAKQAGLSVRAARRAGVILLPRGEFSVVLAGIGVAGGVSSDLRPLTVTYVLVLAIGGSLLARFVD